MLKKLEEIQPENNFIINLEMNTLEETFINIGMDDNKFFNRDFKDQDIQ